MNRTKFEKFLALTRTLLVLILNLALSKSLYAATQFEIDVPKRGTGAGSKAIFQVDADIYVDGTGPVTFRVTDPEGASHDFNLDPSAPCTGSALCTFDFPPVGSGADSATWILPPAVGPIGDPSLFKYELTINPTSNTDFLSSPGDCQDVHPGGVETYTVEVLAGPGITSACLLSYELNAVGDECNDLGAPLNDALIATINSGSSSDQLCRVLRPGIDAALVLDKSGSMNGSPMAGPSGTKIQALKLAVDSFIGRWTTIRAAEPAPPSDQVGVVLFDSDSSWLGAATGLDNFTTVAPTISGAMASVGAGGGTSIGDGLSTASGVLGSGSNRRVILLMSDGKENTHQRVQLWDTLDPDGAGPLMPSVLAWSDLATIPSDQFESRINIQLGSNSTSWVDLANEDSLRIYAITIGAASAVSAEINQGLALATGGFYINSETDADILPVFFVELLQNFVKFNTWNVVALRAAETGTISAPYQLNFPLTSTSVGASIDLSWNPEFGALCIDVLAPGSSAPETVCNDRESRLPGRLSWSRDFVETNEQFDSNIDWQISVHAKDGNNQTSIPFFLIAMAEEINIKTDFEVGKGDYVPGSKISIQAKINESGRAMSSNLDVTALVASPKQSIGDLLAASSASTQQPTDSDSLTDADAKLANELSKNLEALQNNIQSITLLDNGDSANGDSIAGDGIYTAFYQTSSPGHYNILFNSQGKTARSGKIHTEQLISIYVRNQPDTDETVVTTSVIPGSGDSPNILNVNFTPKTKNGYLMGPGWANYFWLKGVGVTTFKPKDNLDGTYTATTSFLAETPPALSLHFLDAATFIEDSVGPDALPLPLDASTTVLPEIDIVYTPPASNSRFLYFILLIIILLILYLLIKRLKNI